MNLDVFLSILFSSGLFIILRLFSKFKADNFHGIVINYFVAAACAFISDLKINVLHISEIAGFFHISMFIGLLFIFVFTLTAKVTQVAGVGTASVASKLSMIIPITAGIFLYQEVITGLKVTGLVCALVAVYLVSLQQVEKSHKGRHDFFLPLLLFAGCGLVDASIKYVQHFYFSDNNRQLFIMSLFASAGLIGTFKLVFDLWVKKKTISTNSVIGGLLLGACNYLSLFFLIRSFEAPGAESSKVFAMVNLGVVLLSAFWGILIFREKLSVWKMSGLFTAIIAIIILFFA